MIRYARAVILVTSMLAVSALIACGDGTAEETSTPDAPTGVPGRFNTPETLQSYRYTIQVTATTDLIDTSQTPPGLDLENSILKISIAGERVSPDREHARSTTTFGYLAVDSETIVIGSRVWSRQENNAWRERPSINDPSDFIGQDVALSPSVILGTDDPEYLQALTNRLNTADYTEETVDGRATKHWQLEQSEIDYILNDENTIPGLLPPKSVDVHVWTDIETGVAMRVVLTAASPTDPEAFVLRMELFDVNGSSIVVEEPEVLLGP